MLSDVDIGSGTLRFAKDYIGVDYHNDGHSHIDALCHVAFDGALYNGRPSDSRDLARARRVDAIEVAQGRPGRARACCSTCRGCAGSPGSSPASTSSPRTSRGPSASRASTVGRGRHPAGAHRPRAPLRRARAVGHGRAPRRACTRPPLAFLAERRVAALGSDGNSDTAPSTHRGHRLPDPRAGAQRDGRPPARLPAVRGPRGRLRARAGAGSSCSSARRCASSAGPDRRSTRSRSSDRRPFRAMCV